MKSNKEIKSNMKNQLNDDAYLTKIATKAFQTADKNDNGSIDIKELKACMIDIAQGLGAAIPKDEVIRDEFYKFDVNKNQTLDFQEFKIFVKKTLLILIDRIPD